MEKRLEKVMDDVMSKDGVTGCLFADHLGLCLGAKGTASPSSCGLIVALADMAGSLEPNSTPPVISLESDSKTYLIQRNGNVTGAIIKSNTVTA